MSVVKQRLVKIVAKNSNGDDNDRAAISHHEYITAAEESTDDDGSITYVEDYEINENGDDDDGAFFVEYITEDENLIESNDPEMESNPLSGYVDGDGDGDGDAEVDGDGDGNVDGDCDGDETADDLYNCNLCGMNFKSITEHIEKYHSGQDVLIDISEDGGTMIKSEKPLELDDYQENDDDGGDLLTSDNISINDAEILVYGDDTLEHENEFMDDATDEDNAVFDQTSEVYTYDDATGSLTRATNSKPRTVTNKSTKSVKKIIRPNRLRSKNSSDSLHMDSIEASDHVCEICNTSFYSAKSLKLHARMHLPVKSKTIDEATENDADAMASGEQETPREKFYCAICGKYYDRAFEQVHVQMHNGEEKFNCSICNKVFPNEESINMHMNAHQDTRVIRTKAEMSNIKLPYGCQYCGKEFARPHEKVKHERVHTGEKPYECELCGKCFRVSYCLTIHMRTHTDARPYVCPQCNKRFKAQSVYNHHLLTHSDERNYKCPYCPKTFKTSVQLSGHKNSHTKPFTCTECNRPFGSLYAVRAHMESHKRPNHNLKHICELCGAKYARRFALNDHMKEKHKDIQYVQIVDSGNMKKSQSKKAKKAKQEIVADDDERELEAAGQSILPNMVEQEITIDEIEHFDNEEEVVEMDDWLK